MEYKIVWPLLLFGMLGGCSSAGPRHGEAGDRARVDCAAKVAEAAQRWLAGTTVEAIKAEIQALAHPDLPAEQGIVWGRSTYGGMGNGQFVVLLTDYEQVTCEVDFRDVLVWPAETGARTRWTIERDGGWTPAEEGR